MTARYILGSALVTLLLLAGWLGGGGFPFDDAIVRYFVGWRAIHLRETQLLVDLTYLGGAPVLIALAVIAAAVAALNREKADALQLTGVVLGGRAITEGMKWAVGRPRPALDAHPVHVFSQSFPSAHAGNTMVTYGAIALFALPERWRAPGLVCAVLLSLLIGATRPILGVHWPTDVIGGWCLGALWLLACWTARERFSRVPAGKAA